MLNYKNIYIDGNKVSKLYLDGKLAYTAIVTVEGLCFSAFQAGSTVQLTSVGSPTAINLVYSTDGCISWNNYTIGDVITLTNVYDEVYIKSNGSTTFSTDSSNYYKFVMTGKIAASGSIMWLVDSTGQSKTASAYCFYKLFHSCTSLTMAPELPATTIGEQCYVDLFNGCTSLSIAPDELPATTLANTCYTRMFQNCTELTSVPVLPAETMTTQCYFNMFYGCTSLTMPPELPATSIADSCYRQMFYGCTSLTDAPELPATSLANNCYSGMFNGCSSLTSINVGFTSWTSGATDNWVKNVASNGTFTCPSSLPDTRGDSNIPTNWTKTDI